MPTSGFDDRDDDRAERAAMFLRQVKGDDPWDVRRQKTRLAWWLGVSIALNILEAWLLFALLRGI